MQSAIQEHFFKFSELKTKEGSLKKNANHYERLPVDYYISLIKSYVTEVEFQSGELELISKSSWGPLMKASHNGFILTLKEFMSLVQNKTESEKLLSFFYALELHGFGEFQLLSSTRESFMRIGARHTLDSIAFAELDQSAQNPIWAFTAGLVMAAYNLAMTSLAAEAIDNDFIEKVYFEAPGIKQDLNFTDDYTKAEFSLIMI